MTGKSASEIRLDLAEGHWSLEEFAEALHCLGQVLQADPRLPRLAELVQRFKSEGAESGLPPEVQGGLDQLASQLERPQAEEVRVGPALATPTMAQLLRAQGHEARALEVLQDVLRRNPDDERARAVANQLNLSSGDAACIAVLENWLDYFRSRGQGENHA